MKDKPIIYQVVNRLFGNPTTTNRPNGSLEENGCGKFSAFTNIALSEIRNLGCTHIWYTGVLEHATGTDYTAFGIAKDNENVVKGKAGSPYAIKDYYDVDPDLATDVENRMKEFEKLIKRSHKEELKVIIDFIPNHLARQYVSDAKPKGVVDFGADDRTDVAFSPDNNFYYIPNSSFAPHFETPFPENPYQEFPAKATGNDCFTPHPGINDWYETVKLNYGVDTVNNGQRFFNPTPNTWKKMLEVLLYWSEKGVDGFRCDMAEMVPVEFWRWVIPQVKQSFPEIIFIAEVYNPNEYRNYILNGKFDYLYDKVGLYDTLKAIVKGTAPASAITGCWQSLSGIENNMLNFLENHDEQRIASDYFVGNATDIMPALIVSATISKAPFMLYFGQELGEKGMESEGFSGMDGRTTIFDYWNPDTINRWYNGGKCNLSQLTKEEIDLRKKYNRLMVLCNEEQSIRKGEFFDLMYVNYNNSSFNAEKQYAFIRKYDHEMLLIVVNFDHKNVEIDLNIPMHAFEFLRIRESAKLIFTDLCTGDSQSREFTSTTPFKIKLRANTGVILKCFLLE